MARWWPVLDVYASLCVTVWAEYALAQCWLDCERLAAGPDAAHQSAPAGPPPSGGTWAASSLQSMAEMDVRILRATFRDACHEAVAQLRSAGAEIDRAGAGVRGAIHTMSRVLPGMVEQCGGVPSAQESIRRAVIAAQFEDINGQVLAHAASRLRAVEAMVDGLASLGESVLDVLEAASVGSLDLGDIGVRLHQAVAVAQALRAPCAPAPTSAGGSVDFF